LFRCTHAHHGFANLAAPTKADRKWDVNEIVRLRRSPVNAQQNPSAYNSNDRSFPAKHLMFIIRCAFWLTIVFASLPWPQDAQLQSPKLLAEAAASLIRSAGGRADMSAERCLAAPQTCIEQAKKVQALFEAAARAEPKRARPAS
jgi:hypothetical protein